MRRTWNRHVVRPALLGALAVGVVAAASGPPGIAGAAGADGEHRHMAAQGASRVCGGLPVDDRFREERASLGTDHACEHLEGRVASRQERRHPGSETLAPVARAIGTGTADIGQWTAATNPGTKTIGISAVLFHTGKVLLFGGKYKQTDKNTASYMFDPVTRTGHEVPAPAPVFCGGITLLADGRMFSSGGADPIPKGIVDNWIFDAASETWWRQPDTPKGRYYPTTTELADGRVLITAGTELDGKTNNPDVEVFTPPPPGQNVGTLQKVGPAHATRFYPLQWLMPDGKVLQVTNKLAYTVDPANWAWSPLKSLKVSSGAGASSILLPPAGTGGTTRLMVTGGLVGGKAQAVTQKYDYADAAAGWSYGTPMPTPRAHMNLVLAPDGTAFGIGGNSSGLYDQGQTQTMRYDPATDTWTNLAVQSVRRGYHSTALLLPDGRIMSAGDTGAGGGKQAIDFYSPPYLFQGPRPQITSAPTRASYGATVTVGTSGATATRAVLMAPGATTHADEMHARRVEVSATPTSGGLSVTMPQQPAVAPPGWYMLFVMTDSGVPSVATWVQLT